MGAHMRTLAKPARGTAQKQRRARKRARAYRLFRRAPEVQRALLAEADALRRSAGELEMAVV